MSHHRSPGFLGVNGLDEAHERAHQLADTFAQKPTAECSPVAREALESIVDISARAQISVEEREAALQAINWTALAALSLMSSA